MKFLNVLSFMLAFPVFAQENAGPGQGPCKEDVQKLCGGIQPGSGAIMKCMKEHEGQVSAACKGHMEQKKAELKEKFGHAKEACEGDKEKHCKDVKPGAGAIIKCLKSHEAELSAACKESLPKGRIGRRR